MIGEPVIPADRCSSMTALAHSSRPVAASSALITRLRWPMTSIQPLGETVERTGAGVLRAAIPSARQRTQPVLGSSA